jgi:hypothetical protein
MCLAVALKTTTNYLPGGKDSLPITNMFDRHANDAWKEDLPAVPLMLATIWARRLEASFLRLCAACLRWLRLASIALWICLF